ncbi:hypothetical protein, partial [Klebsiella pneumoniae]|uniref:hypothetical protein n=1 Tax=Klebsiella pneumoniae TaxID=573 RepID=UPI001BE0CB99
SKQVEESQNTSVFIKFKDFVAKQFKDRPRMDEHLSIFPVFSNFEQVQVLMILRSFLRVFFLYTFFA